MLNSVCPRSKHRTDCKNCPNRHTVSLLGLLAKIKSVVSVLISLISDTTPIGGQDIKPIFVGRRRV